MRVYEYFISAPQNSHFYPAGGGAGWGGGGVSATTHTQSQPLHTFLGPTSHSTALVYRLDYFPPVTPVIRLHPLRIPAATTEYQQDSSVVFTLRLLQTLPAATTIRPPTISLANNEPSWV